MMDTTVTVNQFMQSLIDTVYMISISLFIGALIGIPLGILLVITRPGGITEHKVIFKMINPIVNIVRSLPFIILLCGDCCHLHRLIVIRQSVRLLRLCPLIIYMHLILHVWLKTSILEVDEGIIEAADSMGATPLQTIWYFMLPEAFGSCIFSLTTATIGLLGATAMAGAVGGGGVGDLAISCGYQRFDSFIMLVTVIVLIVFVQIMQSVGNWLAAKARREH